MHRVHGGKVLWGRLEVLWSTVMKPQSRIVQIDISRRNSPTDLSSFDGGVRRGIPRLRTRSVRVQHACHDRALLFVSWEVIGSRIWSPTLCLVEVNKSQSAESWRCLFLV